MKRERKIFWEKYFASFCVRLDLISESEALLKNFSFLVIPKSQCDLDGRNLFFTVDALSKINTIYFLFSLLSGVGDKNGKQSEEEEAISPLCTTIKVYNDKNIISK